MKYKVIGFDLDNTLLDTQISAYQTGMHILLRDFMKSSYRTPPAIAEHLINLTAFNEYGHRSLEEIHNWYITNIPYAQNWNINDFFAYWRRHALKYAQLFPWTERVLRTLKNHGYRLALVTNGGSAYQRGKLSKFDDISIFDSIIISEEWGQHKPDVSIFEESLRQMHCEKDEYLFIGDNCETDIIGAHNAGIPCFWINYLSETLPFPIQEINSVYDLITTPSLLE